MILNSLPEKSYFPTEEIKVPDNRSQSYIWLPKFTLEAKGKT